MLLPLSAVELSLGFLDAANLVAVYAFYVLVLGVVLQIASYVKYGEGAPPLKVEPEPTAIRWGRRTKVAAVAVVAIVAPALGVGILYPQPPLGAMLPQKTYPELTIKVSAVDILHEPDNSTVVGVIMTASRGSMPYNYTARWSDGFVRTSPVGAFPRTLHSNQAILPTVTVIVTSSDRQKRSDYSPSQPDWREMSGGSQPNSAILP